MKFHRHHPLSLVAGRRHLLAALFILALIVFPPSVLASDLKEQKAEPPPGQTETVLAEPAAISLVDVVPRARELVDRGLAMEENLANLRDFQEFQEQLRIIRDKQPVFVQQLATLKISGSLGVNQISEIRQGIRTTVAMMQQMLEEVGRRLALIEGEKNAWKVEKDLWKEAGGNLQQAQEARDAIKSATASINGALRLLDGAEKGIVAFQSELVGAESEIQRLGQEVEEVLAGIRGSLLKKVSPSMLSPKFFIMLGEVSAGQIRAGWRAVSLPEPGLMQGLGWVFLLQILLFAVTASFIQQYCRQPSLMERWPFLVLHPYSVGVLAAIIIPSYFYEELPMVIKLLLFAVGAAAASRLAAGLLASVWRRRLVYLLTVILLLTESLRLISLPAPLFRIYVAFIGLAGAALCFWRARENSRKGMSFLYVNFLRLGSAVLFGVFIAELGGFSALGSHLLEAGLTTTFLVLFLNMLRRLLRGGLEFALQHPALQRYGLISQHHLAIHGKTIILTDLLVWLLGAAAMLRVWGVYDSIAEALNKILSLGFFVGEDRISLGLVFSSLLLLFASLAVSWFVQRFLEQEWYPRRGIEYGVQVSINHLIHYAFVFVGFLVAISAIGVSLEKFAVLGGALGVGIGFGLQNVVSNFVSGIILLFERPIKVGDVVQLDGDWAKVTKIGLRATMVQTFSQSDVVVPNSEFIANRVTNWTLSDRLIRVNIAIGAAYGSDVALVMATLREIASACDRVAASPQPRVFFMGFGASSLDFEMRAWVNLDEIYSVKSDLNEEIDRRFRAAGIEIAFPQQDLHLRSIDEQARKALADIFQGRTKEGEKVSSV